MLPLNHNHMKYTMNYAEYDLFDTIEHFDTTKITLQRLNTKTVFCFFQIKSINKMSHIALNEDNRWKIAKKKN